MTSLSSERPKDEPALADIVQRQSEQIGTLIAALERQGRMLDAMMRGVEERAAPVIETAPDTLTIAELWTRYVRTLGTDRWVYNVVSMMTPTLAHFAPSLIEPRPRRGRFPARRAVQGPEMLVSSLRVHHWTDWRDWMRERTRVGPTYRNLILKRFKAFLNWAVTEDRITENQLLAAKTEPKQPRRETTMTEQDLQRILERNPSPAFRAHLLICADTGMRTDEARRLTWDQIDMFTGNVRLSWTVTKTKKSRTVRLMPRDLMALRALPRYDHSRYVFARSTKDAPYSQARFWSWFRAAADAVGVPCAPGDGRIHFHDSTRHSWATAALRAGLSLSQTQKLLGHSSIQTTGLYVHTTESDLEDAHRLLRQASRKPPHATEPPEDDK